MELSEFVKNFESQLDDVAPGVIEAGTSYKELEAWDSMNVLTIIAMVDRKYKKQISSQDFEKTATVQDLFDLIRNK